MAGLDMMTVLAREIHSTQRIVRGRAARNPNEVIEETRRRRARGSRIDVAAFGGSWTFIGVFLLGLVVYVARQHRAKEDTRGIRIRLFC